MRTMKYVAAVAALLLFVSGCAGAPSASPSPENRAITVRIVDLVPLDVYWNYNDVQCTAQEFMEAKVDRGPQVTISDGAGKVLASQDGPLIGGITKLKDRCTVDVAFTEVPASDVYVVTVKGHSGRTWDRTVQASAENPQVIEVSA